MISICRLPFMDQNGFRGIILPLEEIMPLQLRHAGLLHQRLSQRVVTFDEIVISRLKFFQKAKCRNTSKLPTGTPVTVSARQHQIPHSIQIYFSVSGVQCSEAVSYDVIDIAI